MRWLVVPSPIRDSRDDREAYPTFGRWVPGSDVHLTGRSARRWIRKRVDEMEDASWKRTFGE